MAGDPKDTSSQGDSEERLRSMKSPKKGASALSFAWLPVVLIVAAVALLFWWLTQTIQPDRERALGTPPAIAVGTVAARGATGATPAPVAGLTVSEVLKNRQRYGSERVSVTGRYRGRDARGELKGQPAVTVNDWVLSDGTSAIWVTGRPPADLSLSGEKDIDTTLVVEGVLTDVGGKTVLDASSIIVSGRNPAASAATPGVATTPGAGATPGATGSKNIQPGAYVKVTGTEGSQLSYRSGPGANNARVAEQPLLPDGTRLKVLEGPTKDSDGRSWWRLQTDKGVIGWAAEDFLQTTEGP
ncbi:MAG: SH3 domain-containing protein [Anaerolineae bacterium]|nr:SH3 domain-containing protein [Anaerolineae bacterium]